VRRRLAAVAVVLAVLLTACGGDEPVEFAGTPLDTPFQVPDVPLTDTEGEQFSLAADTDKRLTLVFFGYTNCKDICHTVMGALATALRRIEEPEREQVQVVFVSTDPERDTPEVLREYLDRFDPSFVGLTGDLETIIDVGRDLAVGIDRQDPGGHTTRTLAVDSADEVPVAWRADTSAAQFAADIHTLLEG
jgi:protein SCO1/2